MKQPSLSGRTVLVTRTQEGNSFEAEKLKRFGATVIEVASIKVGPPSSWSKLDDALSRIAQFDWIIFTSVNGVEFFFDRCATKNKVEELKKSTRTKFACVGPSTKNSLEDHGFTSSFEPQEFLTSKLAGELASVSDLSGSRILLPRAEKANKEIVSILESVGAIVEEAPAYMTSANQESKLGDSILSSLTDITLTSPSTVEGLSRLVDFGRLNSFDIKVHCIGPVTAKRATELGLKVTSIAETHTIDGMLSRMMKGA